MIGHGVREAHVISIHALHTEGDTIRTVRAPSERRFQSTPSIRRATRLLQPHLLVPVISIHALHTEGDS